MYTLEKNCMYIINYKNDKECVFKNTLYISPILVFSSSHFLCDCLFKVCIINRFILIF